MSIINKGQVKVTMRQKKIGNVISWESNVTTTYCCVTNHPKTSWLNIYFAHIFTIWAGFSRDPSSLLQWYHLLGLRTDL